MRMNADDIDFAAELLDERAPDIAPYARYLQDWKDTINANSDGWAYWRKGSQAADKLSELISQAFECARFGSGTMPAIEDLKKSLRPIKAAATRHGLEAPTLNEDAPAPRI